METADKIDLSALQDGNLHLIAFHEGKFVYLVADPRGSEWVLCDTLANRFPLLTRAMLDEAAVGRIDKTLS